jgi:hypothetical protein
MTDDTFNTQQTEPVQVGVTYGRLTVRAIEGKRSRCDCACGATDVWRDTYTLRASQRNVTIPQCKRCARDHRHRKPGRAFVRFVPPAPEPR